MPELPEVETVKRTLVPHLLGRKFAGVEIYQPGVIAFPDPESFAALLAGKTIEDLDRRGKYLLFRLAAGYCLVAHLRMTGRLVLTAAASPAAAHTHVIFSLDNGAHLHWVDTRRFGRLYLAKEEEIAKVAGMQKLGPEPLEIGVDALAAICSGRQRPIKQVLLDQQLLAGIGNIYADEMLFRAGLHPGRPAGSLTAVELACLHRAMQSVLQQAIANQGTSIRDYVDGSGRPGSNQNYLQVYGRTGQACDRCGRPLERVKIGGRSTHFCSCCQN